MVTPHKHRLDIVTRILKEFAYDRIRAAEEIVELWEQELSDVRSEGYDRAATDIAMKLRDATPMSYNNMSEARVYTAWRHAIKIATSHVGKN